MLAAPQIDNSDDAIANDLAIALLMQEQEDSLAAYPPFPSHTYTSPYKSPHKPAGCSTTSFPSPSSFPCLSPSLDQLRLSESSLAPTDLISLNGPSIIEHINSFYSDELYNFSTKEDELEDDECVVVEEVDSKGLTVLVGVAGICRRIDFSRQVFTEHDFLEEFREAVVSAERDNDYDEVMGYERSFNVTPNQIRQGRKNYRKKHAQASPAAPASQSKKNGVIVYDKTSRSSPPKVHQEQLKQLVKNKEKQKETAIFRVALLHDSKRRVEHVIKCPRGAITIKLICRKASEKFRVKGKQAFKSIFYESAPVPTSANAPPPTLSPDADAASAAASPSAGADAAAAPGLADTAAASAAAASPAGSGAVASPSSQLSAPPASHVPSHSPTPITTDSELQSLPNGAQIFVSAGAANRRSSSNSNGQPYS